MKNANIRFNFCLTQKLKCGFRLRITMKEKLKLNILIFQLQVLETDLASSLCVEHTIVASATKALNSYCRGSSTCLLSRCPPPPVLSLVHPVAEGFSHRLPLLGKKSPPSEF